MCVTNKDIESFVSIYSQALKDGWSNLNCEGVPPDSMLIEWIDEGNVSTPLVRNRTTDDGSVYEEYLHLLRGKAEWATLIYGDPIYTNGEWNGWLKES